MYKIKESSSLKEAELTNDEVLTIKSIFSTKELAIEADVGQRTLEKVLKGSYKVNTTTSLRTHNRCVAFIRKKIESAKIASAQSEDEAILNETIKEFNFTL